VVLNAAVCGIFSSPFPRYQSRIIWMMPAGAMLLALAVIPQVVWSRWRLQPLSGRDGADMLWGRLRPGLAGLPLSMARLRRRALAGLGAAAARIDPAFLRYAVVGATGFSIDGALLQLFTAVLGLDYFTGRLASFSCAVLSTWLLNRFWTFKTAGRDGRLKEAAIYVGVQCAGGAANIAVYTLAVMAIPELKHWLLIPLALGSAVGLCLTFVGAKHLAFRARRGPLPAGSGAVADTL